GRQGDRLVAFRDSAARPSDFRGNDVASRRGGVASWTNPGAASFPYRSNDCAARALRLLRSRIKGHNRACGGQSHGPDNPEAARKGTAVAPHAFSAGVVLFQEL